VAWLNGKMHLSMCSTIYTHSKTVTDGQTDRLSIAYTEHAYNNAPLKLKQQVSNTPGTLFCFGCIRLTAKTE